MAWNGRFCLSVGEIPPTIRTIGAAQLSRYAGSMRTVAYSLYLLPNRNPRGKPYVSSWRMNPTEAAAVGAISPVAGSTEYRDLPETEAEMQRAQFHYQSAGRDSVKPPR